MNFSKLNIKNTEQNEFVSLGLSESIVNVLNSTGYTKPTVVQRKTIPTILKGRDLLVSSPTGSGKTAAFMLPAIQRLSIEKISNKNYVFSRHTNAKPRLLVLAPTRELAVQVSHAAETYGCSLGRLNTVSIFGGVSYTQQLTYLRKNPEIIVATPGRLIDYLQRGRIDLSFLSILVLDEADRMLDMGFVEDIETIIAATPSSRQTLLFSATLDGKVALLARSIINNALRIEINSEPTCCDNISQTILWVDDRAHKNRLISHLLNDITLDQAIVFTSTRNDAAQLSEKLSEEGFASAPLHGDLPQRTRNKTISWLRSKRLKILVATDIAARGIDVPGITHVFNYDLPKFAEDYVHRIGRTGRAGRSGTAISLVEHCEFGILKRIERFTQQALKANVIPGFEPRQRLIHGKKNIFVQRKNNITKSNKIKIFNDNNNSGYSKNNINLSSNHPNKFISNRYIRKKTISRSKNT